MKAVEIRFLRGLKHLTGRDVVRNAFGVFAQRKVFATFTENGGLQKSQRNRPAYTEN
jgi:hypothetical protein